MCRQEGKHASFRPAILIGAFVSICSSLVWPAIKYTVGLRVSDEEEYLGSDVAEIGMEAYPYFQGRNIN